VKHEPDVEKKHKRIQNFDEKIRRDRFYLQKPRRRCLNNI